jgi:hypothetical protein
MADVGRDNHSGIVGEALVGGKWNRNYAEIYIAHSRYSGNVVSENSELHF